MYLAHYTKRFIPEFDAECRINSAYFSQRRAELRREAEEHEKKVPAELAELNRLKAEEAEKKRRERLEEIEREEKLKAEKE